MKKTFLTLISFFALLCAFTSCHGDWGPEEKRCNTKIADYLYGVEYDDYDFDDCVAYFNSQYIPSDFGCSEVRKGRFVGRNLDWYINRNASAIIKINHNDKHYASIGMVGCFPQFNNDLAASGKYDDVYKYLPFKTEDGVNEYGLYVGVNVMPTGETSFDESSWRTGEYGHGAAYTNPSAPETFCVNYLPRILLDRAKTVDEAKTIIANINWTEPKDYPHKGETQSFHWLISDKEKSVVLEFLDNAAVYTEAEDINEPSYGNIMTNFTNCLAAKGIIQKTGIGYERWDILHDKFNVIGENFADMEKLMQYVWYSLSYTIPAGSRDLWISEYANEDYPAKDLYKHYELLDDPFFSAVVYAKQYLWGDPRNWYSDDSLIWFSTHTSVYDLESQELHVIVHEGRSGMKDFYETSLKDASFVKPLSVK